MEKFEQVKIKDLNPGDIFTHEIKIQNREAFKLKEHSTVKTPICISRTSGKEVKKQSELKVFYLRSE
jgi:hypothetical protein